MDEIKKLLKIVGERYFMQIDRFYLDESMLGSILHPCHVARLFQAHCKFLRKIGHYFTT